MREQVARPRCDSRECTGRRTQLLPIAATIAAIGQTIRYIDEVERNRIPGSAGLLAAKPEVHARVCGGVTRIDNGPTRYWTNARADFGNRAAACCTIDATPRSNCASTPCTIPESVFANCAPAYCLNRAFSICANGIAVVHDTVADMFDFDGRLMSTRALSVLGTEISSRAAAERIAQSVGYIQSASARREATALLTEENVGSPRASAFVLTDASGSLWFSVAPRTFARYAVDGTRTALLKLNAPRFLLTANDSLMLVLRLESDSSAVGLELLRLPIKGRVTTSNAKVSACGRTIPF